MYSYIKFKILAKHISKVLSKEIDLMDILIQFQPRPFNVKQLLSWPAVGCNNSPLSFAQESPPCVFNQPS
jgi:hypothetical protein